MTLKIETHFDGNKLTIRLTGRMKEECLEALKALLDNANPGAVLNLGDVSLVGVEVVRFLANCENAGIELVDCSPYIRDWINRELNKTKRPAEFPALALTSNRHQPVMHRVTNLPGEATMSDEILTESSCTATINAPIEFVDIPTWLFNLPDAEYQRCSPAHIAAAATRTDEGRRMSINVETIGGELMVQHYVEDIGEKHHCRVLSKSDLLTPSGWTTTNVLWELSVRTIDAETCELTNHVIGSTTPELLKALGKRGVPLEMAKASRGNATTAHNAQETPLFALSIEKKALEAKARALQS